MTTDSTTTTYEDTLSPWMREHVPADTLKAARTLRNTSVGITLKPPYPTALTELVDAERQAHDDAHDKLVAVERLAIDMHGTRRKYIQAQTTAHAKGKKMNPAAMLAEQANQRERMQVFSLQATIACDNATSATLSLRAALPGMWSNWHEDLAKNVTQLGDQAITLRDQLLVTLGQYRSSVTQLALLDSRYAPLSTLTQGDRGLTVRNVADTARTVLNDEIGTTVYYLERMTFTPNSRSQPGRWLEWALKFDASTPELENNYQKETSEPLPTRPRPRRTTRSQPRGPAHIQ